VVVWVKNIPDTDGEAFFVTQELVQKLPHRIGVVLGLLFPEMIFIQPPLFVLR
jgi:hypothetical protein